MFLALGRSISMLSLFLFVSSNARADDAVNSLAVALATASSDGDRLNLIRAAVVRPMGLDRAAIIALGNLVGGLSTDA